jgi:hypothetical protein
VTAEEAEAAAHAHRAMIAAMLDAMSEMIASAGLSTERLLAHNLVSGVCSAFEEVLEQS